jgi:hypothetical protein
MNASLAGMIIELVRGVLPSLIAELRDHSEDEKRAAELAELRAKVEALEAKKVAK